MLQETDIICLGLNIYKCVFLFAINILVNTNNTICMTLIIIIIKAIILNPPIFLCKSTFVKEKAT